MPFRKQLTMYHNQPIQRQITSHQKPKNVQSLLLKKAFFDEISNQKSSQRSGCHNGPSLSKQNVLLKTCILLLIVCFNDFFGSSAYLFRSHIWFVQSRSNTKSSDPGSQPFSKSITTNTTYGICLCSLG